MGPFFLGECDAHGLFALLALGPGVQQTSSSDHLSVNVLVELGEIVSAPVVLVIAEVGGEWGCLCAQRLAFRLHFSAINNSLPFASRREYLLLGFYRLSLEHSRPRALDFLELQGRPIALRWVLARSTRLSRVSSNPALGPSRLV